MGYVDVCLVKTWMYFELRIEMIIYVQVLRYYRREGEREPPYIKYIVSAFARDIGKTYEVGESLYRDNL